MGVIMDALIEILKKPTIGVVVSELVLFASPLWIAVSVGLVVGWVWKPRWAVDFVGGKMGSFDGNRFFRLDSRCEREDSVVDMSVQVREGEELAITTEDLKHLCQLVEVTDGGRFGSK